MPKCRLLGSSINALSSLNLRSGIGGSDASRVWRSKHNFTTPPPHAILARPIRESLLGFAAFLGVPTWLLWPIIYCFGVHLKMPVYPNAPLLDPTKAKEFDNLQWPLVLFSHGLGGGRTTYSQFCTSLAASGKVVLAVEHRDGTGPVCMPRAWNENGKSEPRTIYYLKENDVYWDNPDTSGVHPLPLRGEQLTFRLHELNITYAAFCRFISNDTSLEFDATDGSSYDKESWQGTNESGQQKVRCSHDVVLAGHSFGGCTVLSQLSTEHSNEYPPIPVERTVILDPWLEPLPSPGPVPLSRSTSTTPAGSRESSTETAVSQNADEAKASSHPRMLVINSENFTLWKDHFARLREVVAGWEPQEGRLLTIVGSEHPSFSDFPILPVVRRKTAQPILDMITKLSLAFLDDTLDETLKTVPITDMEIKTVGVKKDGKPKRKLLGNPGDVIKQYESTS